MLNGNMPKTEKASGFFQQFKDVRAGDKVFFGTYPQTAAGNDLTSIEWRVLKNEYGEILLISEKILDCMPFWKRDRVSGCRLYWIPDEVGTWEKSGDDKMGIRHWLNNGFYDSAFSAEEKNLIIPYLCKKNGEFICNDYEKNKYTYKSHGCSDTMNKVFLLNVEEAREYFGSEALAHENRHFMNRQIMAQGTEYAKKTRQEGKNILIGRKDEKIIERTTTVGLYLETGAWNSKDSNMPDECFGYSYWWLRNCRPGKSPTAAFVGCNGAIFCGSVDYQGCGVRPAIKINLREARKKRPRIITGNL